MSFTIKEIASFLGGTTQGDENQTIYTIAKIQEGLPGSISFLANTAYEKYLYTTQASAVLVQEGLPIKQPLKTTLIFVPDPYTSFANLLKKFHAHLQVAARKYGIEEPIYKGEGVQLGDSIYIGAFVYLGNGVQIGNQVQIYPHSYIGNGVVVGENTIIHSGVKVYPGCHIGKGCMIHAGAVIGSDGFGFVPNATGQHTKIPHLGNVVIEDDVEIGANTTIDRATMGQTCIKQGTKVDNLVQIAHNVQIGENSLIAALSGIAGSAKLGSHCMVGGQVGIAGHTEMGEKTIVAGQSGVTKSYKKGHITLMGTPAMDRKVYLKNYVFFKQLHQSVKKNEA